MVAQGQDISVLPFKAAFYPYGSYFGLAANLFLIFFQGYTAFLNPFSAKDFVINYILLPVSVILYVGYKIAFKTKWKSLEEIDLMSGRREYKDSPEAESRKGVLGKIKDIVIG